MTEKAKSGRDAFTFSLRGMMTIASFSVAPVIAQDRINRAWDEKLSRVQEDQPDTAKELPSVIGRFWLLRRLRRAA